MKGAIIKDSGIVFMPYIESVVNNSVDDKIYKNIRAQFKENMDWIMYNDWCNMLGKDYYDMKNVIEYKIKSMCHEDINE